MLEHTKYDAREMNDEISLYDLYNFIVENKLILISSAAVALIVAIVYLIVIPSTFEAKLRLFVPIANTIYGNGQSQSQSQPQPQPQPQPQLSLSEPDSRFTIFDTKDVFQEFQAQLASVEQWRRFVLSQSELFSINANGQDKIIKDTPFKLSKDQNLAVEYVDVAYQDIDAARTANILAKYIKFVSTNYVEKKLQVVKERIERRELNIQSEIGDLRDKAKYSRQDEIERLRKNIELARSLNVTENMLMRSGAVSRGGADVTVVTARDRSLDYLRGTKALTAELGALVKRKSDDAYIIGLRDKQLESKRLLSLHFIPEKFTPYLQEGEVILPQHPVKPQKYLILLLAGILGGFVGMILIFLKSAHKPPISRQIE